MVEKEEMEEEERRLLPSKILSSNPVGKTYIHGMIKDQKIVGKSESRNVSHSVVSDSL